MWCQKRITSQDLLLRFKDGKHRFYLESVCARPLAEGSTGPLCDYCSRLKSQIKTQDVRTFPHGIVTEEYPPESHIYGGSWYEAKVKAYGPPSESDIELAMEAQRRAKGGRRTTTLQELVPSALAVAEATSEQTNAKEKENNKIKTKKKTKTNDKSKEKIIEKSTIAEQTVVEQLAEHILHKIPATAKLAETMDDVLRVENVVRITLRPFNHEGIMYWKDDETGAVYERTPSGKRGPLVEELSACV
jgi:hypothetical protein